MTNGARGGEFKASEEAVEQTETELSCTFCVRNGGWLAALDMRLDSTKTFIYIYIYIRMHRCTSDLPPNRECIRSRGGTGVDCHRKLEDK